MIPRRDWPSAGRFAVICTVVAVAFAAVIRASVMTTEHLQQKSTQKSASQTSVLGQAEVVPQGVKSPLALTDADLRLASGFPSLAEKRLWVKGVKTIWMRPPCCGACSILKQKDFKRLAAVLADSSRDTPESRQIWNEYRLVLMTSLKRQDSGLFQSFVHLRQTEMSSGSKRGV
ncbi:MAG: hypothetical protein IT209_06635 [Armatimonadetes bacterium]|nr:hypothetical protein [Armatimonadota bacterium]